MKKITKILLLLFLTSASVLSFEIIATRISSVIFVNSYAFAILSLAVMGLASGGIYEFYKGGKSKDGEPIGTNFLSPILFHSLSCLLFVVAVVKLEAITSVFLYFGCILLPFFFAGRFYSKAFKEFPSDSYKIYSADLTGAAVGALLPLVFLPGMGPVNGIILVSLVILSIVGFEYFYSTSKAKAYLILGVSITGAIYSGVFAPANFLGEVPIGEFEEKDFYHVYDNPTVRSTIIDSKWSIFGRSDLVRHSNQDIVRHIFIDGAAGSQMYRFGGDVQQVDPTLSSLLLQFTNSIPFLLLEPEQKNNMLVIGPGGGKEILTGLISDIGYITGVEINSDFVNIVREESDYNGGIYTDFPNVNIRVSEGREFVKQTEQKFDLIVMALPSTQQLQSIDSYALSENYLLTVESIRDYLNILTPEGQLIFTVHNNWELSKLILTTIKAFEEQGINRQEALNHLVSLETTYSPTLVIKKQAFSTDQISRYLEFAASLPPQLPQITYTPYNWNNLPVTLSNRILKSLSNNSLEESEIIENEQYNIAPVYDDNPYFYNLNKGIPDSFSNLLKIVVPIILLIIIGPFIRSRKAEKKEDLKTVVRMISFFTCLGAGFMMMEIALFQKLILFLGSPTISLSVLLCSILVGMGLGSIITDRFIRVSGYRRMLYFCIAIIITGAISISVYPMILEQLLNQERFLRAVVTFVLVLPLGFVLGIPFPTSISLLEEHKLESYIPWMYGLNGAMSIFGSIFAVVISMVYGFTTAFLIGLGLYLVIVLLILTNKKKLLI